MTESAGLVRSRMKKNPLLFYHISLAGIVELGQCQPSTISNFNFKFKPAFQTQLGPSGFILHPKKHKYSPDLLENYKLKSFEASSRPLQRLVKCCSWSIHQGLFMKHLCLSFKQASWNPNLSPTPIYSKCLRNE